MSVESVMPSNHLILCSFPSSPALNLSQHHHIEDNNDENVWNSVKFINLWLRDTKSVNAVGKMAPIALLHAGCHKPSICLKKKKKCNYFQSTVKRKVIKEAMLAFILQNWGTHTQLLEILLFWLHLQELPSAEENYWAQICTFPLSAGTDPVAGNIEAKGAGFLLQGRHFWNGDPSPALSRAFWGWVDTL